VRNINGCRVSGASTPVLMLTKPISISHRLWASISMWRPDPSLPLSRHAEMKLYSGTPPPRDQQQHFGHRCGRPIPLPLVGEIASIFWTTSGQKHEYRNAVQHNPIFKAPHEVGVIT